MTAAPFADNEAQRLAGLRRLGLLDTLPEERFDSLVELVATILRTPIALVTLVDRDRQWFKSKLGIDRTQTHRDVAFCAHAIVAADDLFVLPDAALDSRFADNPLVTGDPGVRFYAGHVLRDSEGLAMGTLCAIDRRPREIDEGQKRALAIVARLVEREFLREHERDLVAELAASRRLLDATLETAPVGLSILDSARRIVRCNSTFAEQAGRSAKDLVGVDVLDLLHADDRDDARSIGDDIRVGHRRTADLDQRVIRDDGTEIWINTHLAAIDDSEHPLTIAATFDVTAQRRMTLELTRFSYLFEHASDIICVLDETGQVLYASPSANHLLGYPEGFLDAGGVLERIHPDDLPAATAQLAALAATTGGSATLTVRIQSFDGVWKHLECVGVNLINEPSVRGMVFTARDTTERQRFTEQLTHRASHDTLTDLANRSALDDLLARSLASAADDGRRVGLCFMDLDGFKLVNDTFGHAAGDRLLIEVADLIRANIRLVDTAARIGGDEFVIVLESVGTAAEALPIATRVRDAIVARFRPGIDGPTIGASVGIALSDPGDTPTLLLSRADAALYRAKSNRNSSIEVAADVALGAPPC
ncbi:MAG: diguanylate cyclase [Ilumatobacteraceae bacterium]